MIHSSLKRQYERTMREAYAFARSRAIADSPGKVLDCGAGSGHELTRTFDAIRQGPGFHYKGLEWSRGEVEAGRAKGLDIVQSDLNAPLPLQDATVDCAIAYSVVEHLLMPCSFMAECHRVLRPGGRLVILTPNISTWFTALQVMMGRMPSSGPHPDSNWLLDSGQPACVSDIERDDVSLDTPQHRHLVVFSYKVLRTFLLGTGFEIETAKGFGYYPFPVRMQPLCERLDAAHCHQMVFSVRKPDRPFALGHAVPERNAAAEVSFT